MKTDVKDIIDYLGNNVKFDDFGGDYFWGEQDNGHNQMIAEFRGFGSMQNLFKIKNGEVDFDKVEQFRKDTGNFIAEAINEKIERERK